MIEHWLVTRGESPKTACTNKMRLTPILLTPIESGGLRTLAERTRVEVIRRARIFLPENATTIDVLKADSSRYIVDTLQDLWWSRVTQQDENFAYIGTCIHWHMRVNNGLNIPAWQGSAEGVIQPLEPVTVIHEGPFKLHLLDEI